LGILATQAQNLSILHLDSPAQILTGIVVDSWVGHTYKGTL
jgi:hypothetical protein